MPSPTLAGYYDSGNWATQTAQGTVYTVASVVVQTGDILTVFSALPEGPMTLTTPAGGGLVYTQQQKPNADDDSGHTDVQLWTTTATSSTTFSITSTKSVGVGSPAGLAVFVWRNAVLGTPVTAGSETAGTAPSLAITTVANNSAVAYISSDWNAIDGTTRTWRTINSITPTVGNGFEKVYARDSAFYTVFVGYWGDVGAAGSKTTGLTAPTGQLPNAIAIEIQGAAAAAAKPKSLNYQAAVYRSYYW